MDEEESGVDHIAHSNHQEIQLPISHNSQNDVSIKGKPKRELSSGSLFDHATPNKKPFHLAQSSSTSTQNDNMSIEYTLLNGSHTHNRQLNSLEPLSQRPIDLNGSYMNYSDYTTYPQSQQNNNFYYQHQTEIRASHPTQGQFYNMMTETNVTTTTVAHRNQFQPDKFNEPYSRMMGIEYSGSRHPDFTKVRDALSKYYEEYLRIQRVSGETHTLEKCYVNLAVVKAIDQQQIDREQLKAHSESFIRMQSYEN
ncbi:hypothetical protein BGZ76_003766, partial [Entomortierella beljakovae]